MKLFGRNFFVRKPRPTVPDVSVTVLRGLLEAHRTSASPEERLKELMELGNRELRPDDNWPVTAPRPQHDDDIAELPQRRPLYADLPKTRAQPPVPPAEEAVAPPEPEPPAHDVIDPETAELLALFESYRAAGKLAPRGSSETDPEAEDELRAEAV